MEPESSLPWTHKLAIGLYPEPDESNPRSPTSFRED
jgi:hypothetical protein